MRKILLSGFITAMVFSVFAQVQVGKTTYDLQTNVAGCRRVATNADGDISITYTRSHQNNTTWDDRGTGYNYSSDNGATWATTSFLGTFTRPDSVRTGWPNPIYTATKEVIVSHLASSVAGAPEGLQILRRDIGTGTWDKSVLTAEGDATWARAASRGDSIVIIYGLFTTIQPGLTAGGMGMYTTIDGGDTWVGPTVIPQVNATNFSRIGGDVYSIDMNKNGKIAIALGSYQVEVLTSTDFGATFTKNTVVEVVDLDGNVTPLFDGLSGETMVLTEGGDGAYSVIVDDNDLVHLWFGRFQMQKDEATTTGVNYFPLSEGIVYWNENLTAAKIIHETRFASQQTGLTGPFFSNEVFSAANGFGNQDALYRSRLVSMPSAGYDTNGNLFVAYSAIKPATFDDITDLTSSNNISTDNFHFRDVYMIKSSDNGATWVGPINVSNMPLQECVYPGVPRKIYGTDVPVIWQEDDGVGISVQAPTGVTIASTTNKIMFKNVSLASIVTPTDITSPTIVEIVENENEIDLYQGCELTLDSIFSNDDVPTGPNVLDYQIVNPAILATPGTHTIQVYVLDAAGNSSDTIPAVVTVIADNTAPVVTLVGPNTVDVLLNAVYTDPGITVTDNACDPSAAPAISTNLDVTTAGTYTYTYTVTDNSGNVTMVTRTVNVISADVTAPVITPITSLTETIEACSSWSDAGVTAFDNIDYDVTANVTSTGSVNVNVPGIYTITYEVIDNAGNVGTIDRTITVEDNTAPVLTVSQVGTLFLCKGSNFVAPNASATDCVDNSVTLSNNGNTVVNMNVNGVYTVTYTATDDYSNSSTKTISVQVGEKPVPDFNITSAANANIVTVQDASTGSPNYWEWDWNDPNFPNNSFGQNQTHPYATPGTYEIVLKVNNNFTTVCNANAEELQTSKTVTIAVGIAELYKLNASVNVFPNPSNGVINVSISDKDLTDVEIKLTNIIGETLANSTLENTNTKSNVAFDLGNDAAGIYFVTISTKNASVTKKVLVK